MKTPQEALSVATGASASAAATNLPTASALSPAVFLPSKKTVRTGLAKLSATFMASDGTPNQGFSRFFWNFT